jgi:hypothetical protein
MAFKSTNPLPGDNPRNLLAKLLQLFGGSPVDGDGLPQLLKKVLQAATAAGSSGVETQAVMTYSLAAKVDFDLATMQTMSLSSDWESIATLNKGTGKRVKLKILADGFPRDFSFPNDWQWLTTKPAEIAANKTGLLILECWGTTEADVTARWYVEA